MTTDTQVYIDTLVSTHKDFITKSSNEGKTRAAIEGYLQFQDELSVNISKLVVTNVLGKNEKSDTSDWEETIKVIRNNYGKVSKSDLIEKMMIAKDGKKSSMNHAYNYIKFAQEYARQELEEYKDKQK